MNPADEENELKEEFFAAIGRFTIEWAELELALDILLLIGRRLDSAQPIPTQLAEKLKTLRQRFLPRQTGDRAERLKKSLDEVEHLAARRHEFIHGAAIAYVVQKSVLTVTMHRMLKPKKSLRHVPIIVTAEKVNEFTTKVYELAGRLWDVAAGADQK